MRCHSMLLLTDTESDRGTNVGDSVNPGFTVAFYGGQNRGAGLGRTLNNTEQFMGTNFYSCPIAVRFYGVVAIATAANVPWLQGLSSALKNGGNL
jgi:hypothetical protein